MLRKAVAIFIILPLVILLLGFAVANRQIVTVSFDPFDQVQPASSASMPLFILIFVLLIAGVVIGGTASWLRQHKWRSAAKRLDAEARALHDEIDALRRQPAQAPPPSVTLMAERRPEPAALAPPPAG